MSFFVQCLFRAKLKHPRIELINEEEPPSPEPIGISDLILNSKPSSGFITFIVLIINSNSGSVFFLINYQFQF